MFSFCLNDPFKRTAKINQRYVHANSPAEHCEQPDLLGKRIPHGDVLRSSRSGGARFSGECSCGQAARFLEEGFLLVSSATN